MMADGQSMSKRFGKLLKCAGRGRRRGGDLLQEVYCLHNGEG